MGAVLNLRPDLYRAVLAYVPFVDVMNTMADASCPSPWASTRSGATRGSRTSTGDAQLQPVQQPGGRAYPSILVRTSYNDSQVMYWEPAK